MSYTATIVRIDNVQEHPNADRLALTRIFGSYVVISKETQIGDLGVYFPSDGQLSYEFVRVNNLFSKVELNADPTDKPGYFDTKCRVRAQRFRGVKSDGIWVPYSYLVKFAPQLSTDSPFQDNDDLTSVFGVELCRKYIPRGRETNPNSQPKQEKKKKTSPMFLEHFDTPHFSRNVLDILVKKPDIKTFIITEKLHGTSGRICYGLVDEKPTVTEWVNRLVSNSNSLLVNWFPRIASWITQKVISAGQTQTTIPQPEYKYLNGSRLVVLKDEESDNKYHSRGIRDYAMSLFRDKLHKGETVYFEIVGFEPSGAPIMPSAGISPKEFDKDFIARYGKTMTYSYGCEPSGILKQQCDVYVYRITFTNEDGVSVDLPWNDVLTRCDEMRVKTVPVLAEGLISDGRVLVKSSCIRKPDADKEESLRLIGEDDIRDTARLFEDDLVSPLASGPSVIDAGHIKEGVCVRVESSAFNPQVYKYKSYEFKVLEGIVKDSGVLDQEEAEGLIEFAESTSDNDEGITQTLSN